MASHLNNVVSLFGRSHQTVRDWTQAERAQFYRVEAVLIQAGMAVEPASGLTDEGDPWFAFYHRETGDVFVHFARIDGLYIVESPALQQPLTETDFTRLVSRLAEDHPLLLAKMRAEKNNVTRLYMHPSALLFSAVAVLFFKTQPAEASEADDQASGQRGSDNTARTATTFALNEMQTAALIGGLMALPLLSNEFERVTPESARPADSISDSASIKVAELAVNRSDGGSMTDSYAGIHGDASDILLQVGPEQFQSLDDALLAQRTVDVEAPSPERGAAVAEVEPDEPATDHTQHLIEPDARGEAWLTASTADMIGLSGDGTSSDGTDPAREETGAAGTAGSSGKGSTAGSGTDSSVGSSGTDKMSDAEHVLLAAGILDNGDGGKEISPAYADESGEVDLITIVSTQNDADLGQPPAVDAAIDLLIRFAEVAGDFYSFKDAAADVVFIYDTDVDRDHDYAEGTVFHHAIGFDDGSRVELIGFNGDFHHLDLNVA